MLLKLEMVNVSREDLEFGSGAKFQRAFVLISRDNLEFWRDSVILEAEQDGLEEMDLMCVGEDFNVLWRKDESGSGEHVVFNIGMGSDNVGEGFESLATEDNLIFSDGVSREKSPVLF